MMTPNSKPECAQGFARSRAEKKTHTSYLGDVCCVSIGNDNMTCSGVAVPYHTLHNTPHSPLLPTTTPHTANHTPHTDHLKPLSSRNIPLNPSPSNLRPHTLHIRPRTSDRGRAQAQGRRAQSPVGPRLPPFLSDNCCCQCFFAAVMILFAAVIGVLSGYISFLAASIAQNMQQLNC